MMTIPLRPLFHNKNNSPTYAYLWVPAPVFAVIANLVMKRYVDDVFSAVSVNEVERLLSHLNSGEPSIQLPLEHENERCLRFLVKCFIKQTIEI